MMNDLDLMVEGAEIDAAMTCFLELGYRALSRPDPSGQHEYAALGRPQDVGAVDLHRRAASGRSEEHTSELQSLMRISYAVFCLKKKKTKYHTQQSIHDKSRQK